MSDKFKRRRRRTGSTSARFKPSQLVPVESARRGRIGKAELAACGAVAIVAFALIVLIWIVTQRAMVDQRAEIRDRAERSLSAQAATMAETIGHELLLIDQSLTILQSAWKLDSDQVDLTKWQQQMPALTAVADDLFIADEKQIIRQDILPKAIGQGVGSAYVTFPHGSLELFASDGTKNKDSLLLQGQSGADIDARLFLMYVVRPLDHPKGWIIGASYRSEAVTKMFAEGALGFNPVVALVDTRRGVVQAVVGPSARRPRTDISKTALFSNLTRSPNGTWTGETGIDDAQRLHAFHRVLNRDIAVVVAANLNEVMLPAETLAAGAQSIAFVGSALVLAFGALVLWELYTIRSNARQQRTFERNRSELERLRGDETALSSRAGMNVARMQALLEATSDGVAMFDSSLRLVQWNHRFARGSGIDPQSEMPLDTLLRAQAMRGLFGEVTDLEAEIARRAGILRTGDGEGVQQLGPDGETLTMRGLPVSEGGFMLILNGLTSWQPMPPQAASVEVDRPAIHAEIPATPAAVEW